MRALVRALVRVCVWPCVRARVRVRACPVRVRCVLLVVVRGQWVRVSVQGLGLRVL